MLCRNDAHFYFETTSLRSRFFLDALHQKLRSTVDPHSAAAEAFFFLNTKSWAFADSRLGELA